MILTSLVLFSMILQLMVHGITTITPFIDSTINTEYSDSGNGNTTIPTNLIKSTITTTTETLEALRCPEVPTIDNGYISEIPSKFKQMLIINCDDGYDLNGPSIIYCKEGQWDHLAHIECSERCQEPPHLENGRLDIDGDRDVNGYYHKGTVATYSCENQYQLSPKESQYRVCEKGIWTGQNAICIPYRIITGCQPPKPILNGYFVHEKNDIDLNDGSGGSDYSIGQRLHYSCKSGYILDGDSVQLCLDDGTWSPKIPPICTPQITEETNDLSCSTSPHIPHSFTTVVHGLITETGAIPGTILEIQCNNLYRNIRAPCQPGKLRCHNGRWVGVTPICVPAHGCDPPPAVSYAVIYNLNDISFESTVSNKYPIKSQISYQCLNGYTLQGNEVFACSTDGCWLPVDPPTCYRTSDNYYLEVNSWNAVLVSAATGAGVLSLLLIICLITVCRRRRPLTRAVTTITPPVTRTNLGDHATLLHHPDRLALIAFADGLHNNNNNNINNNNDQNALPTYEEATRERPHASLQLQQQQQRLHRPHWPNLSSARRSRNVPNLEIIHIPRHGSFASHTPSTRSAGDSMGSTDTVALSEGSTNITLDTASSYSGSSQPASCRVHCGSLASFDTSSVVNTEGVPLLEESELEEIHVDDSISLVVDNPSISDNVSMKLSNNSADLA